MNDPFLLALVVAGLIAVAMVVRLTSREPDSGALCREWRPSSTPS